MNLSDQEIGYLAGIVDGEGCLTITRKRAKYYASGFKYIPLFKLTNTNIKLLEYLRNLVGSGCIIAIKHHFNARKPLYQLDFYANTQRILLPLLTPLLKCKKEQAEILIKLLNLTQGEELYQRIKVLNNRGR